MQTHLSIGENHRFELHEALLIYRDRQSSFITRHDVTVRKDAPPTLGPAQPLTVAFIESLTRSLSGSVQAEVLPANILLDVPYEGLVADQESWSRRMIEFIGLPWDVACLDFHRTERRVMTASKWQVRQRISSASVGRWRNYQTSLGPLANLPES